MNPQAKRGYSRDKRFDCKQVLVGLVIDRDDFPKTHEIFSGERKDSTTLDEMFDTLERRVGKREGAIVVVDRGMAFKDPPNSSNLTIFSKSKMYLPFYKNSSKQGKVVFEYLCLNYL